MPNGADAMLDTGRLRVLREVGLRGSIAAAGRSLGLTASAVSQQLALLEREAGVSLVDRSPRGVALTGAGHVLAARAGEVLDVLAAARADLDRIGGALGGPVRIAAVASAAATFVSDAAATLRTSHPDIELAVRTAEPQRALELLVAGDVDVAVVDEYDYVPLALPDSVVAEELCREPLLLVRAAAHRGAARPARLDLAQLADSDWVMPPEDAACGQAVRAACRAAGFEPRVRWETDDMHLLARAVAAGHGVAVLPVRSIAAGAADLDMSALRSPRITRRLIGTARASSIMRPVVDAVFRALRAAAA